MKTKKTKNRNQQCTTHGIISKHTSPHLTKKYDTQNIQKSLWDTNKSVPWPQKRKNPQNKHVALYEIGNHSNKTAGNICIIANLITISSIPITYIIKLNAKQIVALEKKQQEDQGI